MSRQATTDFRSSWRLPALLVAIGLVALVGLARSSMKEALGPTPSRPPVASSTPAGLAIAPSPSPFVANPIDLEFLYSPWPDRYADGIPRSISGSPVRRLNAALDAARLIDDGTSDQVLVGGWFVAAPNRASGCSAQAYEPWCWQGRLADTPALLGRGEGIDLANMPALGAGPVVVSAVVATECSDRAPLSEPSACTYQMSSHDVLWQGDAFTDTEPIAVGPLISSLAAAMWFEPLPFHEGPTCRLARPAQTYSTLYGDIQMILIFPTTEDRVAKATSVLNAPPFDGGSSSCASLPPLDGRSGWLSRDNVMIRVVDYDGESGSTVRDLLEELSRSASQ